MDAPTSAAAWLAVMLEGSVGAAISLFGVLILFWLTFWADRRKDDRRRADEDRRAREQRTAESTANVLSHLTGIPLGLRRFEEQQDWVDRAQQALLMFSALERADHPHLANWALAQTARLSATFESDREAVVAWESGGKVGPYPKGRVAAVVGHTVGALTMWHAGAKPDEWFRNRGYRVTAEGVEPS